MAHIVLADDDAAIRELVARALRSDGHTVALAADGQEALDLVLAAPARVALLIADVEMPLLDGIALAEQVLRAAPKVRCLLVSGLAAEVLRAGRLRNDRVATLSKPFTLDQLRAEIRRLLG